MQAKRPFTEAEIAAIRARYPTEGSGKLAKEMNRRVQSVGKKASTLGVGHSPHKRTRGRHWSDDEQNTLRSEWPRVRRREIGAQQLADRLGITIGEIRSQVSRMGLCKAVGEIAPWSEEELEILADHSHLLCDQIRRKLERRGFKRTEGAIHVRRYRMSLDTRNGSEAYSAQGLGRLLGVNHQAVGRWIRLRWLKAVPRGDSVNEAGGPGDSWLIYPKDVRRFLITHVANIDLSRAEKHWLVDLLAGGEVARLTHVQRGDTCGHGDGSGFDEMRVVL